LVRPREDLSLEVLFKLVNTIQKIYRACLQILCGLAEAVRLSNLKQAQEKALQAERLATIGQMVAGPANCHLARRTDPLPGVPA
jgi:hypothetical protein